MSRKTLYLVRHAKSSWKDNTLPDRQRPLNKRGHRNAIDMAQRMAERKIHPDMLIASPAKRAQTTAHYFANEMDYPSFDIQIDERLYFCGVKGYLNVIKKLPDDIDSVMLFGHNPDMFELANLLLSEKIEAFPTCSVAKFKIHTNSWQSLTESLTELKFIETPKELSSPLTLRKAVA